MYGDVAQVTQRFTSAGRETEWEEEEEEEEQGEQRKLPPSPDSPSRKE